MKEFNTFLSKIDRASRQKISKDKDNLNYATDQSDIINICWTLHYGASGKEPACQCRRS